MSADGYELLAHRIRAAYPSYSVSDLTIADWTQRLSDLPPDVAGRVAERMANLPSPPDPADWRVARVAEKPVQYVHALPPGELPSPTPEQRENFDRIRAVIAEKPVGKPYPTAFDSMPDELFEKRPKYRLPPGAMCDAVGKETIRRKGHALCPDCGDDMDPDCIPVPKSERRCPVARGDGRMSAAELSRSESL